MAHHRGLLARSGGASTEDGESMSDYPREHMRRWSLDTMEYHYRAGQVSDADLEWYIATWNSTRGRFTCAEWKDGAIRNVDHSERPSQSCLSCFARGWVGPP